MESFLSCFSSNANSNHLNFQFYFLDTLILSVPLPLLHSSFLGKTKKKETLNREGGKGRLGQQQTAKRAFICSNGMQETNFQEGAFYFFPGLSRTKTVTIREHKIQLTYQE